MNCKFRYVSNFLPPHSKKIDLIEGTSGFKLSVYIKFYDSTKSCTWPNFLWPPTPIVFIVFPSDVSSMKVRKAMKGIDFITPFPDEGSCKIFLKTYRENSGIDCRTWKCFSKQYWYSGSKFFEFSNCRRRTSLKAKTVMESSNSSLHIWFTGFLLMSATKKGFFLPLISETVRLKKVWDCYQSNA